VKVAAFQAWSSLRGHRTQTALTAAGVAAVAAMVGAAVTVGEGLATGFDRAATRADVPDVIATFDQRDLAEVRARVQALPNVAGVSFRLRERRVHAWTGANRGVTSAQLEGVMPGRRGYAVVEGHDLSGAPGEALVEAGLARTWHIGPGDSIGIQTPTSIRPARGRVVGVVVAPDNVAYPLASAPRIWLPYHAVRDGFAAGGGTPVDEALIWARDPTRLDVMLEQARAASFGIGGVVFVTRPGMRVFIDRAAGIVIALLVAFSVVALGTAAVMLAAASRVDVQRRLEAFGTMRALGASRRRVVATVAFEKALVAVPATTLGIALGWAAADRPTRRLLAALDQFAPGWDILPSLVLAGLVVVVVVVGAAVWPAWRTCTRAIAQLLRSPEVRTGRRIRGLPSGAVGLGVRMVASRPVRVVATTVVLAASGAVVLLMLALAGLLSSLEHDPGIVGKRYQLATRGSRSALEHARSLPGVAAAALRFSSDVADSYDLGQTFQLVAYCGDRLRFEAPALESGRRAVRPGEAEVGQGLATALGLRPGSTLAVQFGDGDEARFRVAGVVDALDNDGRMAYVQPGREICHFTGGETVIQLDPGADRAVVASELVQIGRPARTVGGVTANDASFLGVLVALLRTVAVLDGIVCAYVVAQMMLLTARERRSAVAVLRACGASRRAVGEVFAGTALPAAVMAAPVAVLLEAVVLGPAVSRLTASYVAVSLGPTWTEVGLVAVGLVAISGAAAAWVAHGASRDPVSEALQDY
jgi:ABC-type lipoprotein release transport system permease subunit